MKRLLFAFAGPVIWFLLFSALYAIETLACTPAVGIAGTVYGQAAGGAVIGAAVLFVAVAVSQFVMWQREEYLAGLGLMLTGLSVAAAVWTAWVVWVVRSCGG